MTHDYKATVDADYSVTWTDLSGTRRRTFQWSPKAAEHFAKKAAELKAAGVDYKLVKYPGAVHSFTHKAAGDDNSKGAAYNAAGALSMLTPLPGVTVTADPATGVLTTIVRDSLTVIGLLSFLIYLDWKLTLTTGETTGGVLMIDIIDQGTKAVEDQGLDFYTFGNASAYVPRDIYSTETRLRIQRSQ